MFLCKVALLWSIVMVLSGSAADYCIKGAYTDSNRFTGQGEYVDANEAYNGKPSYKISSVGNGCQFAYIYIKNNKWYIGETKGGSYNARCSSETSTPSDCNQWERGTLTLENIQVISGSCPEIECSNFKVSAVGSTCDGIFDKKATNSYDNADSSRTWYFNDMFEKMFCSGDGDQSNACSTSGTYVSQSNAGFTAMKDGDTKSIAMSNGKTGTFECGVTPSPVPAPVSGGYCVTLEQGWSNTYKIIGQYESDGSYNSKPRYKLSCSSSEPRFIVYYSSSYGYLIANGNGDSISISTYYGRCTNNIDDITQCSWTNGVNVDSSYTQCLCTVSGDVEPVSFDKHFGAMPIDNIDDNNNYYSFFDETIGVMVTSISVIICILCIAICAYRVGFSNGKNTNKNIYAHDNQI